MPPGAYRRRHSRSTERVRLRLDLFNQSGTARTRRRLETKQRSCSDRPPVETPGFGWYLVDHSRQLPDELFPAPHFEHILLRERDRFRMGGVTFEDEENPVVAEVGRVSRQAGFARVEWRPRQEQFFCCRRCPWLQSCRHHVPLQLASLRDSVEVSHPWLAGSRANQGGHEPSELSAAHARARAKNRGSDRRGQGGAALGLRSVSLGAGYILGRRSRGADRLAVLRP